MSRDPGICGTCHEEKVRAKHQQPRIDWENVTASTSGSLGGKVEFLKNAVYPYEYDDKSRCANINCSDGRANISDEYSRINEDIGHAAQTGDWTGVDKKSLERLEQLSEHATEVGDVADIEWLDNDKTREWKEIQDRIDEFENNTGDAIERTAAVASAPDATIHGKEKIPECRSTLDNLDGVRHSIYVQEVVVDTVHSIAERETEQEVVPDAETTITENDRDSPEHDAVGGGSTTGSETATEEQAQARLSVAADGDTKFGISHPDDGVTVALDTGVPAAEQTTINVSAPAADIDYANMPDELGVPLSGDSEIRVNSAPDDNITTMLTGSGSPAFETTTGDRIQVTTGDNEIPLHIDPDEEHEQNRDHDHGQDHNQDQNQDRNQRQNQDQATSNDGMAVSPRTNGHENPYDYLPPGDGRPIDDDERDGGRGTDNSRSRS